MRIYRFDELVSRPIDNHGSNFRLAPLLPPGSNVSCQAFYLPPNGSIGRHEAASDQLFVVVAGSGFVEGSASGPGHVQGGRRIGPYEAAFFLGGEEHEAWSEEGMSGLIFEGELIPVAFAVTVELEVVEYDPAWPERFEELRGFVWPAVEDLALRIEHVGSTSVPGLAAKPVIDADIVVESEEKVRPVIAALAGLGYRWRGDLGVEGRQAFEPPNEPGLFHHHLYLVVDGSRAYLDHALLADLLRRDDGARAAYATLKEENAARSGGDIDWYVAAKARLVAELLTRARKEAGLEPVDYWVPDLEATPEESSE